MYLSMLSKFFNYGNQAVNEYKNHRFAKRNGLYGFNATTESVYGFTNENLRQYVDLLNIAGGRVAVTGSSFDQALYAIYKDAEEVTVFDGCPYAKPMGDLKVAAIKNMKLDEFIEYWNGLYLFDKSWYQYILHDVSDDTASFVQFMNKKMLSAKEPLSVLSNVIKEYSFSLGLDYYIKACDFYQSENAYNELQSKLHDKKIDCKIAEFSKFPKELDGEYETIMLSNIYDYVDRPQFLKTAKTLIDKNLTHNGTMQMYYSFDKKGEGIIKDFEHNDKSNDTYRVQKLIQGMGCGYPKKGLSKQQKDYEDLVYIYEKV